MYSDIQVIAERLLPLQDLPLADLLGDWGGPGEVNDGFALPSYTWISVAVIQEPEVEGGGSFCECMPPWIRVRGSPG